jgi:hypothetical protein
LWVRKRKSSRPALGERHASQGQGAADDERDADTE